MEGHCNATAINQVGDDWVIIVAVWKVRSVWTQISLEAKTVRFATGLDIGYGRKRRLKSDPKISDLNNYRDEVTVKWVKMTVKMARTVLWVSIDFEQDTFNITIIYIWAGYLNPWILDENMSYKGEKRNRLSLEGDTKSREDFLKTYSE